MEYWERNADGKRFDNEEDAYIDSIENETKEDLLNTLVCHDLIPQVNLLEWAMEQDSFWERFQDEITEARGLNFDYDYTCWDDEEPEVDPDGNENPFGSCFWHG